MSGFGEFRYRLNYASKIENRHNGEIQKTPPNAERKTHATRSDGARLQTENWVKNQLVSIMSQELTSLVSGVNGIEEVWRSANQIEDLLSYCSELAQYGNSLRSMLRDIPLLSNPEAGELPLDLTATDLGATIHSCLRHWQYVAGRKNIRFDLDIDPNLPQVLTDQLRFLQIVSQILNNAIKFTDAGNIWVALLSTEQMGNRVGIQFSIEDSGPGLPDVQKRQLMLDQASLTSEHSDQIRNFGGLGLLLVSRLTRLLGGNLSVKSGRVGGTEFVLRFDFACAGQTHLSKQIENRNPDNNSSVRPKRNQQMIDRSRRGLDILVVDDVKINLHVAQLLLRELRHRTSTAQDGLDALEQCAAQKFDVILMDLRMPVMDGLKATRQLRAEPGPNQSTPVIGITAQSSPHVRELCLTGGMQGYLVKPLRQNDVRRAIRNALQETPDAAKIDFT